MKSMRNPKAPMMRHVSMPNWQTSMNCIWAASEWLVGCELKGCRLSAAGKSHTRPRESQGHVHPAPDLVQRDFSAEAPNPLWVADITYIATWTGWLYLAVVVDAWSRKVVGWAMSTRLQTALAMDALQLAVQQRRPQ